MGNIVDVLGRTEKESAVVTKGVQNMERQQMGMKSPITQKLDAIDNSLFSAEESLTRITHTVEQISSKLHMEVRRIHTLQYQEWRADYGMNKKKGENPHYFVRTMHKHQRAWVCNYRQDDKQMQILIVMPTDGFYVIDRIQTATHTVIESTWAKTLDDVLITVACMLNGVQVWDIELE